jgi:AcrR family transcriptional regulator
MTRGDEDEPAWSPRRGRIPGPSGTRQKLTRVAAREFARYGYTATSVRQIAKAAGVDPHLVYYYFGTKEALFGACLDWPWSLRRAVDDLPHEIGGLSRALTALFITNRGDSEGALALMLHAALAGHDVTRDRLAEEVVKPLVDVLAGDDRAERAAVAVACVIGVAMNKYVLKVPPLDELPVARLVVLISPIVEAALTSSDQHPDC